MSLRAIAYSRFSSDLQNPASLADQERVCRQLAEREGWTIIATFSDAAISGASLARPGYQALLAALRLGEVDIIVAESLDRISRDAEHLASFHKRASFAGATIHTVIEGPVSELHVGFKGVMGALYLRDLADRTRRGEAGRILQGRSIGAPPYGYRVLRRLGPDGEPDRGLREIDPAEAVTVQRIFQAYAGGMSPRAIARELNREGIAGPGGRLWHDATIRGRPTRSDGLLRNSLYRGLLTWNRRRTLKEPQTGRAVRRRNPDQDLIATEVPHLRIVEPTLWETVQLRLAAEALAAPPAADTTTEHSAEGFWSHRRPRHLLTGKAFCGGCGGSFVSSGKDYMACQAALQGACGNRRSIRRGRLEAQVLATLRRDLMEPVALEGFVAAFIATWQRLAREAGLEVEAARGELRTSERRLANVVAAVADGLRHASVIRQLDDLEAHCSELRARIDAATPTMPEFPTNLAEAYRERIANLEHALSARRTPDLLEAARDLIERVLIHPPASSDDDPTIDLEGNLIAMLRAAGAKFPTPNPRQQGETPLLDLTTRSVKEAPGGLAPWWAWAKPSLILTNFKNSSQVPPITL